MNSTYNTATSKLLLPPINEIKFSESIKKKLYSKNVNKTNTNINPTAAAADRFKSTKTIADKTDQEKDTNFSENFNTTSTESQDEFFSTINDVKTESSVFTDDTDQKEDDDDDTDDDDDEFIYLYKDNDDKYEEEAELFNAEIKNAKNQTETEMLQLRKQLSFLKKENYYMQLEIYRLENKLKKNKEIQLNTIELEKHLSNLENFFISKHNSHLPAYGNNTSYFEPIRTSRFGGSYNQSFNREDSIISDILNNNHLKTYRSERSVDNFNYFPDIKTSRSRFSVDSEYNPRKVYNLPKLNSYSKDQQFIEDTIYYFKPV